MAMNTSKIYAKTKPIREVILDHGDRPLFTGPTRYSPRDPAIIQPPPQTSVELHVGVVQYGIEQTGWQKVAIGNNNAVIAVSGGGRSEAWGVHVDQSYAIGSTVFVAIDSVTKIATILGQAPQVIDASIASLPSIGFATQVGSWTTAAQDPLAQAYLSTVDGGGAYSLARTSLADKHSQDWSVVGATGIHLLVGSLGAQIAADEVTGLWVDLLDQSTEVSGRVLSLLSDGLRITNDLDSQISTHQQTGSLAFFNDPELQLQSIQDASRTSNEYLYYFDTEPVQKFQLNTYALASGSITHDRGYRVKTGEDQFMDFSRSSQVYIPQLRFIEHTPGKEDDILNWYPLPALSKEDQTKLRTDLNARLTAWQTHLMPSHLSQPLIAFTHQAAAWCQIEDKYVYLEDSPPVDSDSNTNGEFATSESVQFGDPATLDPHFCGDVQNKPPATGWLVQHEDGSLYAGTGLGASIRLVGDSVFIEGSTVRISAPKDISLISRDVNLVANRDVNITCNHFMRLASQKNIGISAGLSRKGGVLIESHSTEDIGDLPDDPREAVYSGVTLSALRTHVSLSGAHVLATASAGGPGKMFLRNKGGTAILSSSHGTVVHGNTVMHTYGQDPLAPDGSDYFSRYSAILGGDIVARNAWFAGAVSAGSHIQSYFGRIADSAGQHVGKVIQVQKFQETLSKQQSYNTDALSDLADDLDETVKPLQASGGPLNPQHQADLSLGFVTEEEARDHYGTNKLQPTCTYVFHDQLKYKTEPRGVFRVTYRPGSGRSKDTYCWPGNTQDVQLRVPVQTLMSSRVRQMLTSDPTQAEERIARYHQVFQTLAD